MTATDTNVETVETPQVPSRKRQFAAIAIATVVTVVLAGVTSEAIDRVHDVVRNKIAKTDKSEPTE